MKNFLICTLICLFFVLILENSSVHAQWGPRPRPVCVCRNPNYEPVCTEYPPYPGKSGSDRESRQSPFEPACYCPGRLYPNCFPSSAVKSNSTDDTLVTSDTVATLDTLAVQKPEQETPSEVQLDSPIAPPPPHHTCICPAIWRPVCAYNPHSKSYSTYASDCVLECAKRDNRGKRKFSIFHKFQNDKCFVMLFTI